MALLAKATANYAIGMIMPAARIGADLYGFVMIGTVYDLDLLSSVSRSHRKRSSHSHSSISSCAIPVISTQAMPNNALTVEALEFLPKCDDFGFMCGYVSNHVECVQFG